MQPSDFTDKRWGRLMQMPEDYWAFVPGELPPKLVWNDALVGALSDADRGLGELAGVGRNIPNPHLLIWPFIRREAVLSSKIEGTQSTINDLLLFEATPEMHPLVSDVHEVVNYVRALDYGIERVKTFPISSRLICELHERLMDGVRGENMTPGKYRTSQNWIGPAGYTLNQASYVPPPPAELPDTLSALEKFIHHDGKRPPLIELAMVHYQFEAIHPFLDGNGRIGRLLITLLLCKRDILPQPLLYLSGYFEKHREAYAEHLWQVSRAGKWEDWITFFLRGVSEQSLDAIGRAKLLVALRETFLSKCREQTSSNAPAILLDELFQNPYITARGASELMKITAKAAQANITKLCKICILEETTGRKRDRVYVARKIIDVVNNPLDTLT